MQKRLAHVPVVGWVTGDMVGSAVPRNEEGEFDWASLYWKVMWFLDFVLRVFGGELSGGAVKED
jgi:hypothetical protein